MQYGSLAIMALKTLRVRLERMAYVGSRGQLECERFGMDHRGTKASHGSGD
jgi:hypothetical protein